MLARSLLSLMLVALLPLPARAAALDVEALRVVGQPRPGAAWTDRPLEARLGEGARLAVVAVAREAGRRAPVYLVDDEVEPLVLGGRRIPAAARRPWSVAGGLAVRWSTVEPHAWREPGRTAPNGTPTEYHTNVSTDPKDFGRWLGYDEMTYFETVVADWSDAAAARVRPASARPPRARDGYGDLGTLRYRVEVRLASGRVLGTPGARAVDRYGILPSVFRVSIRAEDSFVGWLTAYLRVPEIFGSAGSGRDHQTDRFVGADCADVLTGALRAMGYRKVAHTNVASLTRYAVPVVAPVAFDERGVPERPVTGVRVGDVIRIDYGGALSGRTGRAWDHVAILYQDRSDPRGPARGAADGTLDAHDLVVHMGHPELVIEPLIEQLPARIDVLRWDMRRLGRRR